MDSLQKNKQILLSVIGVAILVVAVVGVSFAFFNYTRTGNENSITTGRISFNALQGTTINLQNVFPISSTEAQTDTTNAKTLSITVTGDTDYTGGLEYVVTASDVNLTVGSGANAKTLPIAIEVSVANNGTGSLGTLETGDYYANRNSYTTSKYKVEYNGNLQDDAHILVGYIAPNTTAGTIEGINGIINIKAYIDASKILISDTYNDGNTPTDEKGTPVELGEGKTVFTTSEWNAISGQSALSFKIKVESRQGIWVQAPVPTIASCPGCKFIYTTNEMYTTWNTKSQTPTVVDPSTLSNNYEDVVTSSGNNIFLGVKLNNSNQITNAYACGLKDGVTPFCIEGTVDGSKYNDNVTLLQSSSLWNGACTGTSDLDRLDCSGSVDAIATSYGKVNVNAGAAFCYVSADGELYCHGAPPAPPEEPTPDTPGDIPDRP